MEPKRPPGHHVAPLILEFQHAADKYTHKRKILVYQIKAPAVRRLVDALVSRRTNG